MMNHSQVQRFSGEQVRGIRTSPCNLAITIIVHSGILAVRGAVNTPRVNAWMHTPKIRARHSVICLAALGIFDVFIKGVPPGRRHPSVAIARPVCQWYLQVYVNDTSGNALEGVNVSVKDKWIGEFDYKAKTNSYGKVKDIECTYFSRVFKDKTYHTPHRVSAYNTTHGGNLEVYMNTNKKVQITMEKDTTPPNSSHVIDQPKYRKDVNDTWNITNSTLIRLFCIIQLRMTEQ